MYIKKIELIDIRSYKEASIELSPGINIIVGANNSGKSTILRALQSLQNINLYLTSDDIRKGKTFGQVFIKFRVEEDNDRLIFNETLLKTREFDDDILVLFDYYKENLHPLARVFQNGKYLSYEKRERHYEIKAALKTDKEFKGLPNREDQNNFMYYFLSKRKTVHYSSQGGRESTFSVDDDLRNLPSKVQRISNGSSKHNKRFVKYCKEILGFEIGAVPSGDNSNYNKLGIYIDNDIVYLESMGEGVANILGLLTVLFNAEKKLVLIEELENDIHPNSLKKLLDLILEKSKNCQFIISTHSNIVLKYLASSENTKIFYTESKMEESVYDSDVFIPTSTISEIDNTPEKRMEVLEKLGYDLLDFDLYSSYIIFEESSAERIVRDFIIPEFVPELRLKVRTIAAGGVSDLEPRFNDFLRLFVYIHKSPVYSHKAWVIADGDESGKSHIKNIKEKFSDWPEEHFLNFSKSNFEEYYPEPYRSKYIELQEEKNSNTLRQKKKVLLNEVLDYIAENKEDAVIKFQSSAKEVIDILKVISQKIM